MSSNEESLKRQLYNRQEYVVGAETQRKYGSSHFLVVGMTGLGCEIVKNLMLTGVGSITMADDTPVQWTDLSSMFYASEADVGRPRAAALEAQLAELNRYVTLRVHKGPVTEELYTQHQVVIYVDHPTTTLSEIDVAVSRCGAKFMCAESKGIAGSIFVNAGEKFVVSDPTGEETVSCVVTGVNNEGIIMCHDDKKHECCEGDFVYFTGIVGPDFMNSTSTVEPKLFKVVKVIGPFILQVESPDFASATPLVGSGYMHTTKQPVVLDFLPLAKSIEAPNFAFIDDDEAKFTAPSSLHLIFQQLHSAEKKKGSPLQVSDADLLLTEVLNEVLKVDKDIDEDFARKVIFTASGNLNPMACIIGGFASQEALKCASGKFTPVQQWLYYDVRELLHNGLPSVEERSPKNNRYDGSVAVFGRSFQEHLLDRSAFVVGAGALGCEFVKNFACLGIACGKGTLHITDMDRIELSNLSRQFLFRNAHIGQPKSTIAAAAAKKINPALNVVAKEEKVAPETESIFNEEFWTSVDFIAGALDNVIARKYVDSRAVFFKRALFESGTLGTKCSTQPVIPFLTESWGSTYDPPEKGIPLCTLKNFPNAIEHTIQWARDCFERYFVNIPNDVNGYLHDANFMPNLNNDPGNKPAVFAGLIQGITHAPKTPADCVAWGRIQFEELFSNGIKQLLHNLPLDKVGENGEPFWSGAKKPPKPVSFSLENSLHVNFVRAAAALHGAMYGIVLKDIPESTIVDVCSKTAVPTFVPAAVSFATSEKEKSQQEVQPTLSEEDLPKQAEYASMKLHVTEFEKDDDTNYHLDFITAVSNLRATNYGIPTEDRTRTKMIAGKIIPAMVTTTALVTGFVGNEILKFLSGLKKLDLYKSAFVNIALPLVTFTTPVSPKPTEYTAPSGDKVVWTLWDRFDVDEGKDLTLKELITLMETRHQIDVTMMSTVEGKLIYSSFGTKPVRLAKKVSEVVEEVSKSTIPTGINHLSFVITPDDDVEVPLLRYRFRW